VDREVLGVQVVEMLIKNIVKIERGALIKGLTVKPFCREENQNNNNGNRPRIATLNVDGWVYPDPTFHCPVIRTIFYPQVSKPSWVKPVTENQINEVGINNCLISDPWNHWMEYKFVELKKDEPVGVHLGEFIIGKLTKTKKSYVNLYTKVLLINGEIGYLTLETENKSKLEAELI